MKTAQMIGGGRAKSVSTGAILLSDSRTLEEWRTPAAAPLPRCITDLRRSRRSLYIRLQTWIARFEWEAFRAGRELEARLLYGELHYIAHLLLKSVRACWLCPANIRDRFEVKRGRT